MSQTRTRKSDARQRIVETAERLFYAEGIRAVGIDRIIAEASVAKMTLYNHFPSKDDLIVAALRYREEKFDRLFQNWMDRHLKGGADRFEAFFGALEDWFKSTNFRGCMFINTCAELADSDHEGWKFAVEHKERFHQLLKEIIAEKTDPRHAARITPGVALVVEGAIVMAAMKQSPKPAIVAKDAALSILKKSK